MSELAEWDSFYVIVGSAAGALIGLQFVVMALIAERPQIPSPEAVGIRDPVPCPRGSVRRWRRGAVPPLHRHSQRLGHRRLPRTCQQEGQERLSGAERMRRTYHSPP